MLGARDIDIIGQLLQTRRGNNASVWLVVAWSPDGTKLASGGWDDKVRIWNTNTGQSVQNLTGDLGTVWSVVWNARNAAELASGSRDSTVKIWNVNAGQLVRTLRAHLKEDKKGAGDQ